MKNAIFACLSIAFMAATCALMPMEELDVLKKETTIHGGSVYGKPPALSQTTANPLATAETKNLFENLKKAGNSGNVLFGHQYSQAIGIGWRYAEGKSDVKDLVGEYPAMSGWDLGKLEIDQTYNFDGINFVRTKEYIKQVYRMGGVNTISWHMNNPVDPSQPSKSTLDSTIRLLFSDPVAMSRYNSWLDKAADYFTALTGDNGEPIPILFRPFHELTGDWFWWGKGHCTPAEYVQLWKYTVDYLKDTKQVHNLLYVYCTDRFTTEAEYMERYPGDGYVDVLAFDFYDKAHFPKGDFVARGKSMAAIVSKLAQQKNKMAAFSESGYRNVPEANWWTQKLLPVISDSSSKLSYALVWNNSNDSTFWCAYPGQLSAPDFKVFHQSPNIYFEVKAATDSLYR